MKATVGGAHPDQRRMRNEVSLLTGAAAIALPATGHLDQSPASATQAHPAPTARTQQDAVADQRKLIGRDVPNAANEIIASFPVSATLFG